MGLLKEDFELEIGKQKILLSIHIIKVFYKLIMGVNRYD